jgi:hypothetical protein
LISGLALTSSFYRRWDGNQTITDNLALTNADFTGPFCVTGPTNQALGSASAQQVCGLFDITPAARPRPGQNLVNLCEKRRNRKRYYFRDARVRRQPEWQIPAESWKEAASQQQSRI